MFEPFLTQNEKLPKYLAMSLLTETRVSFIFPPDIGGQYRRTFLVPVPSALWKKSTSTVYFSIFRQYLVLLRSKKKLKRGGLHNTPSVAIA